MSAPTLVISESNNLIDITVTKKQSVLSAERFFVSNHFYDVSSNSGGPAYMKTNPPSGTPQLFETQQDTFLFSRLLYIGYDQYHNTHVLRGIPDDDYRKFKSGTQRSKKYLYVYLKVDETKYHFTYSSRQQDKC